MSLKKIVQFAVTPFEAVVGGKIGKLATAAALVVSGVLSGNPQMALAGLGMAASAFKGKPKVSAAALERLNASLVPDAPRKGAFGLTALNNDIRYIGYTGTDQEYIEEIDCNASHKIEAYEDMYFDGELAWTLAGGAQGRFAGYLTVTARTEGTAANGIAIDANWTATATLTGCAYLHIKYKRTGSSKKAESPFAQQIPSRRVVRGKGALVPDPRLSTGAGGSGSQDMADQTTWAYTTAADSGRNPACQVLFYLLGWKIGGKLAVGLGIPSTRIDFASFITAANICDESVAKAGGGTEPRYRADGVFSEGDDPDVALSALLAAMNAELTDETGKIGIRVDYDDLSTPIVALTEDDIVDGDDWDQSPDNIPPNKVTGRYVDPSNAALYQLVDFPKVTLTGSDEGSPDGIQRSDPVDYAMVQSPSQAQRLAKLRLQRSQYRGGYSGRFKMRGWLASYGKPVTLAHASLWSARTFRVIYQKLRLDGTVDLVLREAASAQYSWSAEEAAAVTAAAPIVYNPLTDPVTRHLSTVSEQAGAIAVFVPVGSAMEQQGNNFRTTVANTTTPYTNYMRTASWSGGLSVRCTGPGTTGKVAIAMSTVAGTATDANSNAWLEWDGVAGTWSFKEAGVVKASGSLAGGFGTMEIVWDKVKYTAWISSVERGSFAPASDPGALFPKWIPFTANQWFTGMLPQYTTADNASDIVGQAEATIFADYLGAPKSGELSKVLAYKLFKAGAQVTSGITWSATLLGGNATFTVSGTGTATFTLTGPNNATLTDESIVRLTATPAAGASRSFDVLVRKQSDASPTGATGGSGNPGTTVSTSSFAGISSTSYGAVIAGPITVKAGTGGQIRCTLPLSFKRTPGTAAGLTGAFGKVQWSTVGGVKADIAAETADAADAETEVNSGDPAINFAGSINIDVAKTGLTTGVDYEVQFLARKVDVSGDVDNIYISSGTFTAAGS